jgi:hypothetical protein
MNEKDKAKLEIKILNEEYSEPDFGFSLKRFLIGFVIGIVVAKILMEIF